MSETYSSFESLSERHRRLPQECWSSSSACFGEISPFDDSDKSLNDAASHAVDAVLTRTRQ